MPNFKHFLREKAVAMIPGEWQKPNGQTGEPRLGILRDLAKKKGEIQLVDGQVVKITDTDTLLKNIDQFEIDGKTFEIPTNKGVVPSNKVGKTKVFGGGGGAGGGTDQTAIAEPQTCVYIQAMLDNGVNNPDFFRNEDVIRAAFKKCDLGKTSVEDIIKLGEDDDWHMSAWNSAKILVEQGYVNKTHVFHRDSKSMKLIYEAAKKAFQNSNMKPMTADKWNPGDIWAIEKGFRITDLDVDTIDSLNKDLLGLFNRRKVVGISLKKAPKSVQIVKMNIKEPPETENFVVRDVFLAGKTRGQLWNNKGGLVEFDKGTIEIRPNNYMGANKMELQGKGARGGGAGWAVIQNAARKNYGKLLPEHGAIKKMAVRISKGDKRLTAVFHGMLNEINPISIKEVEEQLKDKKGAGDPGWLTAKLGAVYIIYYLVKNKGPKANGFITDIVNYAGSKAAESGPYIIVKA